MENINYYGQKDFAALMGIRGRNTIADEGSFLVAQCNLLNKFGFSITPPALDDIYWSKETYTKPNIEEDTLYWNSLQDFDSSIVVKSLGSGWPISNDAIVKFRYQSIQEPFIDVEGEPVPNIIDHFAVIYDYEQKLIVDSYDGKVKGAGPYGAPVSYCVYDIKQDKEEQPKPVATITYELHNPAKEMHITAPDGAYKWSFGNAKNLNQIEKSGPTWNFNAPVDVVATASVPLAEGTAHYYMTATDLGNYMETGRVNYNIGFNHTHLADGPPVEILPEPPKPVVVPAETITDIQVRDINRYKSTKRRLKEPTWFIVKDGYGGDVFEFDGRADPHWVEPGERILITHTFSRFDDEYYRPFTGKHDFHFGIPKEWLEEVPLDADIQELGTIPLPVRAAAHRVGIKVPMTMGEKAWDVFVRNGVAKPIRISEIVKKKVKGKL
jgi:hypothetical protein